MKTQFANIMVRFSYILNATRNLILDTIPRLIRVYFHPLPPISQTYTRARARKDAN